VGSSKFKYQQNSLIASLLEIGSARSVSNSCVVVAEWLLLMLCCVQPGAESGNVIVVLQQESHDTFSRKGHDLFLTHKLGVTEALCGMQVVVRQLDGRDLVLRNPPGNVIEPGMPLYV